MGEVEPKRFTHFTAVIPAQAGIQAELKPEPMKQPAIYILASQRNGTLYIGVTSNLQERIGQHKEGAAEGFTKQRDVHMLVYYELFPTMLAAIAREKQLKKWNRLWKLKLIEDNNPSWRDLWDDLVA